jgi:hypothetical protein
MLFGRPLFWRDSPRLISSSCAFRIKTCWRSAEGSIGQSRISDFPRLRKEPNVYSPPWQFVFALYRSAIETVQTHGPGRRWL